MNNVREFRPAQDFYKLLDPKKDEERTEVATNH